MRVSYLAVVSIILLMSQTSCSFNNNFVKPMDSNFNNTKQQLPNINNLLLNNNTPSRQTILPNYTSTQNISPNIQFNNNDQLSTNLIPSNIATILFSPLNNSLNCNLPLQNLIDNNILQNNPIVHPSLNNISSNNEVTENQITTSNTTLTSFQQSQTSSSPNNRSFEDYVDNEIDNIHEGLSYAHNDIASIDTKYKNITRSHHRQNKINHNEIQNNNKDIRYLIDQVNELKQQILILNTQKAKKSNNTIILENKVKSQQKQLTQQAKKIDELSILMENTNRQNESSRSIITYDTYTNSSSPSVSPEYNISFASNTSLDLETNSTSPSQPFVINPICIDNEERKVAKNIIKTKKILQTIPSNKNLDPSINKIQDDIKIQTKPKQEIARKMRKRLSKNQKIKETHTKKRKSRSKRKNLRILIIIKRSK